MTIDDATTAAPPTVETIEGKITRVHRGASIRWSAGKIKVNDCEHSYAVKGLTVLGTIVTFRGKWVKEPKWGRQFSGEVVPAMPATTHGVREWLARTATGIGATRARKLVDEFDNAVLDLCESDPDRVAAVAGVSVETIRAIAFQWAAKRLEVIAFAALVEMGLTGGLAERVYAHYKGAAPEMVRQNPYALITDVFGVGWNTADEIARKIGIPTDSPERFRAAVRHVVGESEQGGSTATDEASAVSRALDLCKLPAGAEGRTAEFDAVGLVRVPTGAGGTLLATEEAVKWERTLWDRLATACDKNPHISTECAIELADKFREVGGKTLDDTQLAAVRMVAMHRLTFVTGSAGSGKTLVARAITEMFASMRIEVRLTAPTGKAARRLTDVIGREAETIHRLLGYRPTGADGQFQFEYHAGYQFPSCVVIVDEVSMVDSSLAYHLLSACGNNVAVVLIGDPNQLPPVGPGALLRDAIEYNLAPIAKLGICHRQAGVLKRNCNEILGGRLANTEGDVWLTNTHCTGPEQILSGIRRLFTEHLPRWGFDPVTDTQFLTARHAGPLGTEFLNRFCQWIHQTRSGASVGPEPKPDDGGKARLMPGDKCMCHKNDYDLNIMNGTQGVVIEAEPRLIVQHEDRIVEYPSNKRDIVQLSYVCTPHKFQGSEVPCAVVILPKSHAFMQHRNWLYTASTRAQKTCVIVGDSEGSRRAVTKVENNKRTTLLATYAQYPETSHE